MSNLSGSGILSGALRPSGGGGSTDVYWDDILEKPDFAAVATSGSYNDLTDKPNIPTYTAGDNISITNGEISATYTAGSNVSINNGEISATDTTYTAGEGITIEGGVISASGGGGVTKDLLYKAEAANDHPAQIVLSHPIDNYDILVMNIDFYTNGRFYTLGYTYDVAALISSCNVGFDIGSGGNCWYSIGNDMTTLTFLQNSGSWHIASFSGVKF